MTWCQGGHGYCRECLKIWRPICRASLYKPMSCPVCRQGIPVKWLEG